MNQIIDVECSAASATDDAVIAILAERGQVEPASERAFAPDAAAAPEVVAPSGETVEHVGFLLDECRAQLRPRGAYKIFNPAICTLPPAYTEPGIKLVGTMALLHGKEAYDRMRRATHCVLMGASPGGPNAVTAIMERLGSTERDRVILDACLTALVESASDETVARIEEDARVRGLAVDTLLRPGESDFPPEMATQIAFYVQADRRLGLAAAPDGSIEPRWGTLGVMGMYERSQRNRKRACGRCRHRRTCSIRAIGMNCHGGKGSFDHATR